MHLPTSITILTATLLTLTTSLTVAAAAATDLGIEKTHTVECTRKTVKGDTIHVHYRGTLAGDDGSEFDSSYKRGVPLTFPLGRGRVIKGSVFFFISFHLHIKFTLKVSKG